MSGKTTNESKAKYNAKTYDRINIAVPKGRKAELQALAKAQGKSVNGLLNDLIDQVLSLDPGGGSRIHDPSGNPE